MNSIIKNFKKILNHKKPLKFLLSRVLWKLSLSSVFTIKMRGYRIRFFPSSVSALYWVNPDHKNDDEMFFQRYIKNNDNILDIGANIGTHTLTASLLVGQNGKIISIEANPRIFSFLQRNVKLNGFKNIILYNFALGDQNKEIFLTNKHADDMNYITCDSGIKVQMKKLDNLNLAFPVINLMKIDVEGYEKFVFMGGADILKKRSVSILKLSMKIILFFHIQQKTL